MAVGISAAIVDFGLLYILTEFGHLHYLLSATISFIAAVIVNYSLNKSWTFASSGSHLKQFPIFLMVAVCGIIINNGILYTGVEKFDIWYIYAKIIATVVVMVWNFAWNKHLTFRVQ